MCGSRSRYCIALNFHTFELFVPTVLPNAFIIHLILNDQWLLDLDFFVAKMFAAQQIVAAAPAGETADRTGLNLVSSLSWPTQVVWTSPCTTQRRRA